MTSIPICLDSFLLFLLTSIKHLNPCMLSSQSLLPDSLPVSGFLKSVHPLTWKTSGWPGCCADGCWTCCSLEVERWWGCWPCHCGQTLTPSAVRVWNCPAVCPVSGAKNTARKNKQLQSANSTREEKLAHYHMQIINFTQILSALLSANQCLFYFKPWSQIHFSSLGTLSKESFAHSDYTCILLKV